MYRSEILDFKSKTVNAILKGMGVFKEWLSSLSENILYPVLSEMLLQILFCSKLNEFQTVK